MQLTTNMSTTEISFNGKKYRIVAFVINKKTEKTYLELEEIK